MLTICGRRPKTRPPAPVESQATPARGSRTAPGVRGAAWHWTCSAATAEPRPGLEISPANFDSEALHRPGRPCCVSSAIIRPRSPLASIARRAVWRQSICSLTCETIRPWWSSVTCRMT